MLKTTLSLCPQCLAHVQAAVYVDGGKVFIRLPRLEKMMPTGLMVYEPIHGKVCYPMNFHLLCVL